VFDPTKQTEIERTNREMVKSVGKLVQVSQGTLDRERDYIYIYIHIYRKKERAGVRSEGGSVEESAAFWLCICVRFLARPQPESD
jgi:hypothetical protein